MNPSRLPCPVAPFLQHLTLGGFRACLHPGYTDRGNLKRWSVISPSDLEERKGRFIGFPTTSLLPVASGHPSGCSPPLVLPQSQATLRGSAHFLSLASRIHISSWYLSYSRVDSGAGSQQPGWLVIVWVS